MKYKVRGYQRRYVSEDIFEADNEQEATNLAFNSHYKGGLMLKYMENEEANQISFIAEPYWEEEE
jgi:hypothetical protein